MLLTKKGLRTESWRIKSRGWSTSYLNIQTGMHRQLNFDLTKDGLISEIIPEISYLGNDG